MEMKSHIFGTDGIRSEANRYPMTPEIALQIGKALVLSIKRHSGKKKILIGKDTRLSGYIFETALTSGICSMGADVLLTGPLPTAAISHLTKSMDTDAGIMISASHNPAHDNGFKFFDSEGFKYNNHLEEKIDKIISTEIQGVKSDQLGKAYRVEDAGSRYVEFAKQTADNISLDGLRVVLDCANGAAYHVGPKAISELGAEVILMNTSPNGSNINKNAGVFYTEPIIKKVLETKADLGAILDGDADRLIIIDEKGKILDGNALLAIAAIYNKKMGILTKDTVVATVMANMGFKKLMHSEGIKVHETAVGDKYVSETLKINGYSLGGEPSGHMMFSDLTASADGIVATLKILEIMKNERKKLSELNKYKTYPQILINKIVKAKPPIEKLSKTQSAIKKGKEELRDSGQILVRYSGTEELARVMVEGQSTSQIKRIAEKIAGVMEREINSGQK
ncbi:MAG: phosphoglucosamine mutase [Candidatus Berkelbacteria bacterium]|nr:phosphoglucosamine mutase [Candidatus Berkelbacteria bacterium]